MYSTSVDFQTKIKENIRQFEWSGTISTATPINYKNENILSGELIRSISGDALEIGTVYASQLTLEMDLPSVSRYELYNVEITLKSKLVGASDVIPMGVFTITEALQQKSKITITAYDAMVKFDDVPFSAALNNEILKPYDWLQKACSACGVTLGSTSAEIQTLPNGTRPTGFADSVADVETWRDVLGYLAAYLGGFAYIGRDGYLYIGSYKTIPLDTIPATFRTASNLSDFRTTYDGLYAIYKDRGVQEYVHNTNSGGIVLNIGTNPFLQFSDDTNRQDALQNIINAWDGIYYVPYSAEIPMIPSYDPGDVILFTDNQADVYDYGAITEITYNIGGLMTVVCSGDNPRLAEAQDRFTKTLGGLSQDYNNGQEVGGKNFWILITENTSSVSVSSTKTQVAEIEFNQTVDVQKIGLMFTCEGTLSTRATMDIEITIDDEPAYTFIVTEEKTMKGKRVLESTCGFRISGKGTHVAKVYLTITDAALLWSDF